MAEEFFYRKQVVEIFGCDEDFLNQLESEDLVHPVELNPGQEPVFPVGEVERIRIIANLMRDLEVNLPGVEVILGMRENMILMQHQFNRILEILVEELKDRFPK
jgi:MerR family transcriptional regulator, heat shock protein HspR